MPATHPTRRRALSLAALTAFAASCGTESSAPAGSAEIYTDTPQWNDALVAAGAELKRVAGVDLSPGNTIPTTTSYAQVMKQSLRTDKAPDLMKWWPGYRLRSLARTGGVADLTRAWDRAADSGWVDPRLRESLTVRDRVHGIPIASSYWVMFYNTRLFEERGFAVPESWDDLIATAVEFQREGITPFFATTDGGWSTFIWFQEILTRLDPGFYQRLTEGEAKYTDPTAVEAMRIWKSMFDKELFTPLDMTLTDAALRMDAGKLAMIPYGTFAGRDFSGLGMKPGADYDAFILPMIDTGADPVVVVESGCWTIPKRAARKDEAFTALESWLHPDVQEVWSKQLQDISANPQVRPPTEVLARLQDRVITEDVTLLNRYWEASPPALVQGAVEDFAAFMLDPGSYRSVLRSIQEKAEAEWRVWREEK